MQDKNIFNIETYDFSIIGLIKEGFKRSEGVKLTFIGSILIYIIIAVIVEVVLELIFPEAASTINGLIKSLLSIPFTIPILIGITMLGIKRARDEEIVASSILDYFQQLGKILLAYVLTTIMLVIGFLLLIIPGIYLSVAYAFTYPLVVDKGLDVWDAMELSRKTITKQWFKFFGLGFLSAIVIIISAIPLGIGLIWSIPAIYISYGLLYHHLFDDEEKEENLQEITQES